MEVSVIDTRCGLRRVVFTLGVAIPLQKVESGQLLYPSGQ